MMKFSNSNKLIINSLIFSTFLNVKIFSVILGIENIIPVILLISFLCAFMVNGISIITSNSIKLKVIFYFLYIITLLWIISPNDIANLYYMSAIIFGISSMLITNIKLSYFWITITSLFLGIILYGSIDVVSWILESDAGEKMYYSYLVLPFILFSIYGLLLYNRNLYIIILSIINIIFYIPVLIGIGVRGVFISLILFFLLIFIKTSFFEKRKKYITIFFIIFTLFLITIDWYGLIEKLSVWLANHDIQIYVLEKYLMMFTNDNVSNGRFELYQNALLGFFNSPIWGNGFGVFEQNNEGLYVHNIFLEILFEGGILLSIIFIYGFSRFIRLIQMCKTIERDYYLFVILLFVLGCSILLFSNTLWRVISFWLFFGVILNKFKRNE